jgi:N-carbamoylputrescine amidase
MKIAAVCMHSETGEIERNLDRTEQFVSKASGLGAQLICFPELSLTGYTLNNPLDIYAGLPPDKVVKRVDEMAKGKALIVIAGFIEPSDGQKPFISQIVAGPDTFHPRKGRGMRLVRGSRFFGMGRLISGFNCVMRPTSQRSVR